MTPTRVTRDRAAQEILRHALVEAQAQLATDLSTAATKED